MDTKKIVLYSFGLGFVVGLVLYFNGVVHAQDNNTEISPPAITEYVPNKLKVEAGSYNGVTYWPYPSWQIAGFVNNCARSFPTQYPMIQQYLWPNEMGAFCSCVMDKFRQEWAYDDYVQNFQVGVTAGQPLAPILAEIMAEYTQTCTDKLVNNRGKGKAFAPDPDGKTRRDFFTGEKLKPKEGT